jgi:catechol 2,3-dioxygenase-like lactoylglutathione lyase family enzyme
VKVKRFALLLALTMFCVTIIGGEPPARPPITGIAEVFVSGNNLQQLFSFYSDVLHLYAAPTVGYCLDLSPRARVGTTAKGPKRCMIVNNYQRIELTQTESPAPNSMLRMVAFETASVDQLRLYLTSRGIAVSEIPALNQAGKWIRVDDPDGHSVAFVQRPRVTNFVPREKQVSLHLIHAGFVVHDRAAEDHFYKDILGFRLYWHGGMKDDQDNWVAMQVPDGTDWIEYMLNIPSNADHHTLGVMNHMSLGVEDIHATEKQLLANGWKPGEAPKIGRDGKWQLNLYDPDDTRVEFMEFKPAQEPCCNPFTGPHPGSQK